jgi:hypothetical protein
MYMVMSGMVLAAGLFVAVTDSSSEMRLFAGALMIVGALGMVAAWLRRRTRP